MKKILILMVIMSFLACEKKEEITPNLDTELNIELYGSFYKKIIQNPDMSFRYEYLDTLNYTLTVQINGLSYHYHITKILDAHFVGTIFKQIMPVNKNDNLRVSLRNNIYPSDSYVFMNIFTSKYRKERLELSEFEDIGVEISGDKMEYVTLN